MKKLLFSIFLLFCFCLCAPAYAMPPGIAGSAGEGAAGAADGSIGQIGHTGYKVAAVNYLYYSKFQPTVAGKVNYAHVYIEAANTENTCLAIYASDGTLLASGTHLNTTDVAGWITVTLSSEVTLTAATDYYLGFQNDTASPRLYYATGANLFAESLGYNCSATPITHAEAVSVATVDAAILINNTAAAPE